MALPAENLNTPTRPLLSVNAAARRFDPTRTIFLRQSFVRDFARRFLAFKSLIRQAIVDRDCLALSPSPQATQITIHEVALALPLHQAFDFPRSGDKVEAFMKWLHEMERSGILQLETRQQLGQAVESRWSDLYIKDSYQRGVQRARYELLHAGYAVPSLEATGGIMASMSLPFHIDRVGLLYTRTFSGLKGITDAMDHQISQVLAQAMADGDGARVIAKKLLATIDGNNAGTLGITDTLGRFIPAEQRAAMLARTEVIRALHQGNIQEMKNWGAEGVIVKAEWKTAGFNVCPECASLEGKVFTLDEIESMIPRHPNCRCLALPKEVAK